LISHLTDLIGWDVYISSAVDGPRNYRIHDDLVRAVVSPRPEDDAFMPAIWACETAKSGLSSDLHGFRDDEVATGGRER
jgi:hypothetical protein